ncbi:MAG: hypothetical protein ACOC4M_12750 [Promethearchaeia archaeon]
MAIWWLAVAGHYRLYLNDYKYTRGAHATSGGQTIKLTCDADKQICIDKAVQICSIPDSNNFESSPLEPISAGLDGSSPYGSFNPKTTVDISSDMEKECNGKSTCSYTFKPSAFPVGSCPSKHTQLIGSYTCIGKDETCKQ